MAGSINYAVHVWTVGELVSAATMNAEIGTPFTAIQAAWDTYTPAWTASTTNPVVGNGAISGKYFQMGKKWWFSIKLLTGSTTTYGAGSYRFSLPFTAVSEWITSCFVGDASVGAAGYTTSAIGLIVGGVNYVAPYAGNTGASQAMSPTAPQTFANADRVWLTGFAEST